MEVEDLEWYSPFVFFGGAILSFADPITDILTVMDAMFGVSSIVLPVTCQIGTFTF